MMTTMEGLQLRIKALEEDNKRLSEKKSKPMVFKEKNLVIWEDLVAGIHVGVEPPLYTHGMGSIALSVAGFGKKYKKLQRDLIDHQNMERILTKECRDLKLENYDLKQFVRDLNLAGPREVRADELGVNDI